jgi:hypothetical protein
MRTGTAADLIESLENISQARPRGKMSVPALSSTPLI